MWFLSMTEVEDMIFTGTADITMTGEEEAMTVTADMIMTGEEEDMSVTGTENITITGIENTPNKENSSFST